QRGGRGKSVTPSTTSPVHPALSILERVPPRLRGILPFLIAVPVLTLVWFLSKDAPFFVILSLGVGVNVIMAVSLNIVNGMTGQFSIGHAGFMAVGAYTAGVTSKTLATFGLSFLPAAVSDQVM